MGRSDDSDDSGHRRSKKKKNRRSRSRSKSYDRKRARSRSRDRRSRSRSRDRRSRSRDRRSRSRSRDRRSRSRDRRHRSRDRRSRSRDRRSWSRDRRSRSRDRRSRSREKKDRKKSRKHSRSRSRGGGRTRSRSKSLPSAYKSRSPSIDPKKEEISLTIAEELKRQKQIQDIESESFSQSQFRSDSSRLRVDYPDKSEAGFKFGTSAEVVGKAEAKTRLEQLNSEGLFNPALFGDQAGSTAASAAGWPSNPAANAADSDSDDDNPEERRKKKEEEWRAEKMRKLLEIAQSWDARVEESARKHKSLALLIEAKEEEKLRKAEMNQRKWMKATDPGLVAAATIEPVPPVQAGEDKYDPLAEHMLNDNKIKQVYSSSKILSKVKKKIINQEKEKEARLIEAAAEAAEEQEKAAEEATPKDGVIGSIQEYASLVGKTVKQMKEAQYEVPEESESEDEEEEEEGGDLWGAILGGAG